MKILVTGATGQLGTDVANELTKRNHEAIGTSSKQLDITNQQAVEKYIADLSPDVVINCAAWTAVDAAEDSSNHEAVNAINALGPLYLAKACKKIDAKLIHISTDYVFDGTGSTPWEADSKAYAPLSVYGKSKLEGELNISSTIDKYYIVRTAWAFGPTGNNFVKTMLKLAQTHDEVRVVSDQIGTPTYTPDLARLLVDMAETDRYGYYHATNSGGYISWYDFCVEIYKQARISTKVIPVTTAEYGQRQASRPLNSRLDCSKLSRSGFTPLPSWHSSLGTFLLSCEVSPLS